MIIPDETVLNIEATRSNDRPAPGNGRRRLFGMELFMNLGGCNRNALMDPKTIQDWATVLCNEIDMELHGEPILDFFGEDDLEGWSLLQPIKTSNMNVHCAAGDLWGDAAFLNIFSCKLFDASRAVLATVRHFGAQAVTAGVIPRHTPRPGVLMLTPVMLELPSAA